MAGRLQGGQGMAQRFWGRTALLQLLQLLQAEGQVWQWQGGWQGWWAE